MLSMDVIRNKTEKVKESEKRRNKPLKRVDDVLELDKKWRETMQKADELRHERNKLSDKVAEKKRNDQDASQEIERVRKIKNEIKELTEKQKELKKKRDEKRYLIGNILHESVPEGEDEEDNKEIEKWGDKPKHDFEVVPHADIIEELNQADTEKASEVSGSRFYYLKNDIVLLNLALQRWAMEKLIDKGYTPIQTPYILGHEAMSAAAELDDFEEMLYKIEDKDAYLIATSEQTLAAYHYDEILEPDELPKKYAGISSCFRREAGSHGKDTKGIFRTHRFEKIEQYIFCKPENSWGLHEKLIQNVREIFQDLNLHYRIVNVCTGDMNDNAAKKYDLEAWFPAQNKYRELVSCSNCTDYQARKIKARMRKEGNPNVHTLNSTAVATNRTICCILEQNQTEDGKVIIPEVLRPYMNGQRYIKPQVD